MTNFNSSDFVAAIVGGILISIALSLKLLIFGQSTRFSNLVANLFHVDISKWSTCHSSKFSFLAGIYTGAYLIYRCTNAGYWSVGDYNFVFFEADAISTYDMAWPAWIIAGLFVGAGTRLARADVEQLAFNGVPKLCAKSWVGTIVIIVLGFAATNLKFSTGLLTSGYSFGASYNGTWLWQTLFFLGVLVACYAAAQHHAFMIGHNNYEKLKVAINFWLGIIYGLGLAFSGICRRTVILSFLRLNSDWNPNLLYIFGTVWILNGITYNLINRWYKKTVFFGLPLNGGNHNKRQNSNGNFLVGCAFIGIGWGFGGLSPVTAFIDFFAISPVVIWVTSFVVAQIIVDYAWNYTGNQKCNGSVIEYQIAATESSVNVTQSHENIAVAPAAAPVAANEKKFFEECNIF